jgi:hypothetical protein
MSGSKRLKLLKISQFLTNGQNCSHIFTTYSMALIFIILHVISAGIWIAMWPVMMVMYGLMVKARGTDAEYNYMRVIGVLSMVMGNIAGIGILITGPAMVGIHGWPWFPFDSMPLLAWKQAIYVVILIISMPVMIPLGKKARNLLAAEMAGGHKGPGASPELRAIYAKLRILGFAVGVMVLINVILGTSFTKQLTPTPVTTESTAP